MSHKTASGGLAYFASGSFASIDFADGRVDLEANMIREVREETGIDLAGRPTDPCFHALSLPQGTVIFRRVYLAETADLLVESIERYVTDRGDPEEEILGPVIILSAADRPGRLAPQMPALIDWHFRTPRLD